MCSYKGEAGVSESEETCPWEQRCVYERERESSAASGFAIGGRKRSQAIQVASRSWEKQEK